MRRCRWTVIVWLGWAWCFGAPATANADSFWSTWGDGEAELDGYRLTEPRYGALRHGQMVLIFVTEDFAAGEQVKSEKPRAKDAFYPALKLNAVRTFRTGIYEYRILTSVFARVDATATTRALAPMKVSFSAQEWCGHVFQQWNVVAGVLHGIVHSYFDGEDGASPTLPFPDGGILEDELPIWVRELHGEVLRETRHAPLLLSTLRSRLLHRPATFADAEFKRGPSRPVTSALGVRAAHDVIVTESDGRTTTFTVEDEPPRRILSWHSSDGEDAQITGSVRLPYWKLNHPGDEVELKALHLPELGR